MSQWSAMPGHVTEWACSGSHSLNEIITAQARKKRSEWASGQCTRVCTFAQCLCAQEALACVGKRFSHICTRVRGTRYSLRVFPGIYVDLWFQSSPPNPPPRLTPTLLSFLYSPTCTYHAHACISTGTNTDASFSLRIIQSPVACVTAVCVWAECLCSSVAC